MPNRKRGVGVRERERESKKKGEMERCVNIIIYFNGNVLNTSEGVTFVCSRLAFFYFIYDVVCGIR